jgi:hypothetical protein
LDSAEWRAEKEMGEEERRGEETRTVSVVNRVGVAEKREGVSAKYGPG